MVNKEKELVNLQFCKRIDTYNIVPGGSNGFYFINRFKINNKDKNWGKIKEKISKKLTGRKNPSSSESLKKAHKEGKIRYDTFKGRKHNEKTKKLIGLKNSISQQGKNNSQYGTFWINNGLEEIKIKNLENMGDGWYLGRLIDSTKSNKKKLNILGKKLDKIKKEIDNKVFYQNLFIEYQKDKNISLRKLSIIYNLNHETIRKNFKKYSLF